jgi:phytoene desaturase
VNIFEKNSYPGGKLTEFTTKGYRFDKGPSLFTLPELIDELSELSGYKGNFNYKRLETITNYFYEDGTQLIAYADQDQFAKELHEKLGEDEVNVKKHLKKSKFYYDTTANLFLNQSLHRLKNFINLKTLKGILRAPFLGLNKTMHVQNTKQFKNKKTVQLFNRYATYNGSNPYKAPALMNIVNHLEFGLGAFLPERGMHQITEHLLEMAKHVGVKFYFSHPVDEVVLENNRVKGIRSKGNYFESNLVVSNVDMHVLYNKLLPAFYKPHKLLDQEKSSSAYVFYWGIKKEFKQLGLHNILFSNNYKEEFEHLFEKDKPSKDPTIYINITSKYCMADAPKGCENWFVMVNVPHNKNKQSINYAVELRELVIKKINRMLHADIEKFIEAEEKLDPIDIENQTSSFGGSLYGNASNTKFSAFLRHANYSSKIKGLYLVGGSVHPGGGIPLCLLSGKIASELISEREK